VRTSLYANDAAIFMVPNKYDINYLASIVQNFGDITGIVKNCAKSQVVPIRCANIDLEPILQDFPASRTSLPMMYLGLPLTVKRLKRIHFNRLKIKWPPNSCRGLGIM
jgi:hypothetical protein